MFKMSDYLAALCEGIYKSAVIEDYCDRS
uniref:Uncharacterized protein n=1 Tax=Anguilla anguilla TaxID=7936 RepID=A0A0E9V3T6_ANGAN